MERTCFESINRQFIFHKYSWYSGFRGKPFELKEFDYFSMMDFSC